jgi:dipeptide/tripeptide permease
MYRISKKIKHARIVVAIGVVAVAVSIAVRIALLAVSAIAVIFDGHGLLKPRRTRRWLSVALGRLLGQARGLLLGTAGHGGKKKKKN